jgi:hypothetical protein
MPNGIPIMVNAVPGQALPSNAYFVDQFGNPISYGNVQYAYNPNDINPSICPYCGQKYVAKIEESFNCCTCFIYLIIIILIPILIILAAYSVVLLFKTAENIIVLIINCIKSNLKVSTSGSTIRYLLSILSNKSIFKPIFSKNASKLSSSSGYNLNLVNT